MATFLEHIMGRITERDGAATALEVPVTGLEPALLAAAPLVQPSVRRDRAVVEDELAIAVTSKLLNGWLQNRHQTLYPLTLNFRTLGPEAAATLATLLAITVLAGNRTRGCSTNDAERCRSWLDSVGAGPEAIATFDRAFHDPPALSRALDAALDHDLAAYAYVVAIVGSDPRSPASTRFLDYLEARLDLPTAVIRSAVRKYRK